VSVYTFALYFPLTNVIFCRNEEILKFWAIARFGSDVFLEGTGLQNRSFDSIDDYFRTNNRNYPTESYVSDEERRQLIFDSIFRDFS
jgi:hypothetical protein